MTTKPTTPTAPVAALIAPDRAHRGSPRVGPDPRLRFSGVVLAETVRMRVRSVRWTALLAALSLAVTGPLGAWFAVRGTGALPRGTALEQLSEGIVLAQLIVGSLTAAIAGGRYATGEIRTVLAAAPRRGWVLGAMAIVAGAGTFLLGWVATGLGYGATRAVLTAAGQPVPALNDGTALRVIAGGAVYLAAIALAGLALGILLRSSGAAIAALVAGYYLLPGMASFLVPAGLFDRFGPYLPSTAAAELYALHSTPGSLGLGLAAAVLTAWTAALLAAAYASLTARDA